MSVVIDSRLSRCSHTSSQTAAARAVATTNRVTTFQTRSRLAACAGWLCSSEATALSAKSSALPAAGSLKFATTVHGLDGGSVDAEVP